VRARAGQGAIVKHIVLERRPIPATYFAERVKGLDVATSRRIHEQLRLVGALDDQDFLDWRLWCARGPGPHAHRGAASHVHRLAPSCARCPRPHARRGRAGTPASRAL
jgi:hypothetical protein